MEPAEPALAALRTRAGFSMVVHPQRCEPSAASRPPELAAAALSRSGLMQHRGVPPGALGKAGAAGLRDGALRTSTRLWPSMAKRLRPAGATPGWDATETR
jgi:hypothetical protein